MPWKQSFLSGKQNFPEKDWGSENKAAASLGKMEKIYVAYIAKTYKWKLRKAVFLLLLNFEVEDENYN